MLFLDSHNVMKVLTVDAVIDSAEEAFRLYEQGTFVMPDRMAVACGDDSQLLLMPCVAADGIATKLVTVFPGNRARNLPVIDGIVILSNRSSGGIQALMDGKSITSARTAAVTALSIRHLSKPDARSVGLVGCGVQGYYQLVYACVVRDIHRIVLFDISPAAVSRLTEKLHKSLPDIEIEVAESTAVLAARSDIVITATTARDPVFPNDPELFKGKHIVAIGSFEPEVREYPDAVFSVAEKVWVDTHFASEEAGELLIPLRDGHLKEGQLETLGHFILSGRAPDRGPYGTTFFKSVGMALFDLITARLAYSRAVEQGLGTEL